MSLHSFRVFGYALALTLTSVSPALSQNEDSFAVKQRISRIRELGKKDAPVIPALAQYLSDSNRDIRVEAVKAIVKIGTEASLGPLAQAVHDNDAEVQIRATDGIVNFYVPGYVVKSGLTSSFTRGFRQVKTFFSSRNDQVIDPDVTIRPDVAQALADEVRGGAGSDARANAALAAGILRDDAAVPALEGALHAKESQVIFEALVAIEKIRDPMACSGLSSPAHDLDDRVQATALEAIGILHCLSCASDVRMDLNNPRNIRIRRAALEALAMLAIPGDRAVFQKYASDQDVELRTSALEGLGRVRDPEDTMTLEEAYNEKDSDWKIHLAAAFGLVDEGKVDTSEFSPLPYLVESLGVKGRATTATTYLTELARRDDVRRALFPLVSQTGKDQKIALCSVFGHSQSDDVIPTLNALAKDIDPDIAYAASRALRIVQTRRPS